MVDTYSKLLGLSDALPPPSDFGKAKPRQKAFAHKKKVPVRANQQTSKPAKKQMPQAAHTPTNTNTRAPLSPTPDSDTNFDTTLLTTKEKTKYGTYLTDESIQKIGMRAIQTKRDDHQIVQEAMNQYFERLEK
jgi:hypothetical protein